MSSKNFFTMFHKISPTVGELLFPLRSRLLDLSFSGGCVKRSEKSVFRRSSWFSSRQTDKLNFGVRNTTRQFRFQTFLCVCDYVTWWIRTGTWLVFVCWQETKQSRNHSLLVFACFRNRRSLIASSFIFYLQKFLEMRVRPDGILERDTRRIDCRKKNVQLRRKMNLLRCDRIIFPWNIHFLYVIIVSLRCRNRFTKEKLPKQFRINIV